jgi:hypothetical protein
MDGSGIDNIENSEVKRTRLMPVSNDGLSY